MIVQQMKNRPQYADGFMTGVKFSRTERKKLAANMFRFTARIGLGPTLEIDDLIPYISQYPGMIEMISAIEKGGSS